METILDRWSITAEQLTEVVDENPSLRGMLFGYVAELKLNEYLTAHPGVTKSEKDDDHDRSRKGDRRIVYRDQEFVVESKSLQTNSIVQEEGGTYRGKAQVDASDRRKLTLPNGAQVETTCLMIGEFDILAVNCFAYEGEWHFAFARNEDLPRSTFRGYSDDQRQYLLASLVEVPWPPQGIFTDDLFELMDEIIEEQ